MMNNQDRNRFAAAKFLRDLADIIENNNVLIEPITIEVEMPPNIIRDDQFFVGILPGTEPYARVIVTWKIDKVGIPLVRIGDDDEGKDYFIGG